MRHGFYYKSTSLRESSFSNTKSLLYDGVDEYVNLGATADFSSITTAGSFCVWVKPNGAAQMCIFGGLNAGASFAGLALYYNLVAGKVSVYLSNGAGSGWQTSTGSLTDNAWNWVVATWDGANIKFYLNGVLDSTIPNTDVVRYDVGISPTIGKANWGDAYWKGNIDELSLWKTALTQAHIDAIGSNKNLSVHSQWANTVSWYRMGDLDDSITQIKDRKGSNHGTPTNMEAGDIVNDVPA